jgi:hypothetical protein
MKLSDISLYGLIRAKTNDNQDVVVHIVGKYKYSTIFVVNELDPLNSIFINKKTNNVFHKQKNTSKILKINTVENPFTINLEECEILTDIVEPWEPIYPETSFEVWNSFYYEHMFPATLELKKIFCKIHSEDISGTELNDECFICYEKLNTRGINRKCIIQPCNHSLCLNCSINIKNRYECPYCRQYMEDIVMI